MDFKGTIIILLLSLSILYNLLLLLLYCYHDYFYHQNNDDKNSNINNNTIIIIKYKVLIHSNVPYPVAQDMGTSLYRAASIRVTMTTNGDIAIAVIILRYT